MSPRRSPLADDPDVRGDLAALLLGAILGLAFGLGSWAAPIVYAWATRP